MRNEELLDKVKTVLKEVKELRHNEQFAFIYVALKTLEINNPDMYKSVRGGR